MLQSHLGRIRLMYSINYGISLASLVLAVLIMLCFKSVLSHTVSFLVMLFRVVLL